MAKGNDQTKLLDMCSGAILKKIGANADKLTATFCYGGAVDIPSDGLKLFYMQVTSISAKASFMKISSLLGSQRVTLAFRGLLHASFPHSQQLTPLDVCEKKYSERSL